MPVDELTYPQPVADRVGPAAGGGAASALAPPPVSRVFPVSVRVAAASQRSSTSSPRLYGPAIIRGLHLTKNGAAAGVLGYGLGKSLSAITEVNVAVTVAPPFTQLFTGLPTVGAGLTTPNNTDINVDVQLQTLCDDDSLGIIVLEPEFFLVVYAATNAGAAAFNTIVGHVNVLERVSLRALANFL